MQLLHERWDKSYRTAMQSTIDLELNIFAQRSVDKIEKWTEHQFQHASVASDSTVSRKNKLTCEWIFWCEMHRANRLNTCSESSAFDFHSRMKSTFLSFSRLPILYHRRREFDGWKSPLSRLSCCYSRTQHTAAPCFLPLQKKNTAPKRNPRKWQSCIDVTAHYPQFPHHARFCIEPEVKFHVFVGLKRREEKLIGNLFFRFSYENNMKIWSSK